jgi:ribosomal protein L11 methylase PrmA
MEEDFWKILHKSIDKKTKFFLGNFSWETGKLKEKQVLRDVAKLELAKKDIAGKLEDKTWEKYVSEEGLVLPRNVKKEIEKREKEAEKERGKISLNDTKAKDPIADYEWERQWKKKTAPKKSTKKFPINLN